MTRRILPALSLAAASGLALAGCAGGAEEAGGDSGGSAFSIVASTSVYADLASAVVGDAAEVSAIIDSPTQDPHEYEATARDQLAITEADLVVFNGGGYDSYAEQLVEAGDVDHYVMAVEHSHDYPGEGAGHDHADDEDREHDEEEDHDDADEHAEEEGEHDHGGEEGHDHDDHEHQHIEGFNEHVWYDPHTIVHVVEAIAEEAGEQSPDEADAFEGNAAALIADIEGVEESAHHIGEEHGGDAVFFTEPVGGHLTAAAGLQDVTTEGFAEAVEHGRDVAPATLLAATGAIEGGGVDVVVLNPQTAGPEVEQILAAAEGAGVPVVEYTETLPEGEGYVSWMQANVDALESALSGE